MESKTKKCYYSYEERKLLLESIRYVGEVIPETGWEQKIADVQRYRINTFVMGDDWKGKFDFLKPYYEVFYLSRTPEISTTQIKEDLGVLHTSHQKFSVQEAPKRKQQGRTENIMAR